MPVSLEQGFVAKPPSWNLTIDSTVVIVKGSMTIGSVMGQLVHRLGWSTSLSISDGHTFALLFFRRHLTRFLRSRSLVAQGESLAEQHQMVSRSVRRPIRRSTLFHQHAQTHSSTAARSTRATDTSRFLRHRFCCGLQAVQRSRYGTASLQ